MTTLPGSPARPPRPDPRPAVAAVSAEAAALGEGPRWDAERGELLWVDISAGMLHRARPAHGGEGTGSGVPTSGGELLVVGGARVGHPLGAAAPAAGGGWVLAAGEGFWHLDEAGGLVPLAQPEADRGGATRMNDARTDPRGRLLAGTMAYDASPGAGRLHRLDPDGATVLLDGLTIANGLDWSLDGATLYLADSGVGTVEAIGYDVETGALGERRVLVRTDPGGPEGVADGLLVDAEGALWVAMHGGGTVRRLSPDGELLLEVPLPVSQPTAPCFAGPDLDVLHMTTAREGLDDAALAAQPLAGRVLRVGAPGELGRGRPVVPWAGPVPQGAGGG